MIVRVPGPPGSTAVTFIAEPPLGTQTVSVVGSFNDWDHTRHHLLPGADRRWRVTVVLANGHRYPFRYLTERGEWFNDPDADDHQYDDSGRLNSILDLRTEPPT